MESLSLTKLYLSVKILLRIAAVIVLLFPLHFVSGQQEPSTKSKKAIDAYNLGLKYYTSHNFTSAELQFLTAIDNDPKFIEAYLVLAEVYEDAYKPLKAIETYRKGLPVNESFYPYGYIRLGTLEYKEGLYEQALKSYTRFLVLEKQNTAQIEKANDGIARCQFSIEAIKHPVEFKPLNLGPKINTESDEYWPSLSADEKTLVITRLVRSEDPSRKVQEDFFISTWNDSSWTEIVNAGKPLNTIDNEGAQTISGDGRYMVFTACNRPGGFGRCDLYASTKEGNYWAEPVNLGPPVNTKYRETQPSITSDGRTLYFSSDRPGGKGQHDIWMTTMNEYGKWSTPVNVGDTINSVGVEMSPFIHPDNQSLYFSSDGLIGLGGYDLFVSRKDSAGKWQKPVNLGYPINTNRDEIGLVVNARGDKAYYSSDKNNLTGKDIYVFDLPLQDRPLTVTYMKGKVFDANDHHPLRANFELLDLESGNTIFDSYSDSITGEFLVSIPVNRNYMLNVSRPAYLFFSENFSLKNTFKADKPYLKDIPLQPLQAGYSIILKNVFFETDSYSLKKESRLELNKVVKLLETNPNIRVEIGGHTDNTGTAEYNQKLSENRAKAVTDYLISSSIAADRIVSKGYGFSKPVVPNTSEDGRAQNRRTELKVIE
jgi:outer membrane protein OmpA-like peptidoglycan-associated protein/Tol biopolymer transport system component